MNSVFLIKGYYETKAFSHSDIQKKDKLLKR